MVIFETLICVWLYHASVEFINFCSFDAQLDVSDCDLVGLLGDDTVVPDSQMEVSVVPETQMDVIVNPTTARR